MGHRIFVVAVLSLWAGSMSWLMVQRVLPSWDDAEPPIPAGFDAGKPVAWAVRWSDRPVGFAATIRRPGPQGTTNLESRVVLQDVPLLELAPIWMRTVVGDIGRLKFDASTRLEFDSLDNFCKFTSHVQVNDIPNVLAISGAVEGETLSLKIRSGELDYSPKVPAPQGSVMREALFPDARMPNLKIGRRWHQESYSPFRTPNDPLETIEAEVAGLELIEFDQEPVKVMRVEFRSLPSPGVPDVARLQAIAWVRRADGLVIRQQVLLGESRLQFDRLTDEQARPIAMDLLPMRFGSR